MKPLTTVSVLLLGLALGATPLLLSAQSEMPAKPARVAGKTLLAASDMKWVPMPGLDGATQVALFGDPTKEAHRILYKWPAGTKAPLHTHTHGDRGLIVSGTLSLAVEGAAKKLLPSGSYFSLAAGVKHVTEVEGEAPCVFYVEREGAFDAVMVEAASAPRK
ncbi:MAG: DUF4437 domain-containing protein [Planctomycetes bacterium]|nr:DUF4437 domain-containing protein [Planctomycetota bacterium]